MIELHIMYFYCMLILRYVYNIFRYLILSGSPYPDDYLLFSYEHQFKVRNHWWTIRLVNESYVYDDHSVFLWTLMLSWTLDFLYCLDFDVIFGIIVILMNILSLRLYVKLYHIIGEYIVGFNVDVYIWNRCLSTRRFDLAYLDFIVPHYVHSWVILITWFVFRYRRFYTEHMGLVFDVWNLSLSEYPKLLAHWWSFYF